MGGGGWRIWLQVKLNHALLRLSLTFQVARYWYAITRQVIEQLGGSLGSVSSQGLSLKQPGVIPSPWPLKTALDYNQCHGVSK